MSINPVRRTMTGPTMGTTWSATFYADTVPARLAEHFQSAVDEVDQIASTWNPASDLMRLNAAPPGTWVPLPPHLITILDTALQVGRLTAGAFDIGLGDAVNAWGFGPDPASEARIRAARATTRRPAHEVLDLDTTRAHKSHPMQFDLSGIAKGYGVDRLAEIAKAHGITSALLAIDGELRALRPPPGGAGWNVALEQPLHGTRLPHSVLSLDTVAVATSGDYRHWVQVGPRLLSHTINPQTGAPLTDSPASVTVLAPTCMMADALATALMVMGAKAGADFARKQGIDALFLLREGAEVRPVSVSPLFADRG